MRTAAAGQWTINPTLSLTESYTDNVFLVDENTDTDPDYITEVTPALSIRGSGGRVSVDLDYRYNRLFHANESQRDQGFNLLNARGQAEVLDQAGFIDATASMSRQVTDTGAATSNSAAGQTTGRTEVKSFEVSPYLLNHFGSWAQSEARVRYGYVDVDNQSVPNSTITEGLFRIRSGHEFGRLGWTGTVDRIKEDRGNITPHRTSLHGDVDLRYAVSHNVSLLGGVGYEDIDDNTLVGDTDGVTWNVGLSYNPSPKTALRGTYGHRFNAENISLNADYDVTQRTRFSLRYTDSQQTSQRLINQDLAYLTVDQNGVLIDRRTNAPFVAGDSAFGLQTDTFRQRAFNASVSGTRDRDNFRLGARWESRETSATNIEQIVYGVDGGYSRTLSRRTTANLAASLLRTDFGDAAGRVDNLFTFQGDLSYRIFRTTNAVLAYVRTQRRSESESNGLTENAVSLTLRQEF